MVQSVERLGAQITVAAAAAAMDRGETSSSELVAYYLDRIAALDAGPDGLNSILEVNPQAVQIAEGLDRERAARGVRGPLHGIPVVVKDNVDTADLMHTSAGTRPLADHYARRDAHLVARLRAAGAVILAKANMTEWANFMSDHMPNGYSSRGGQVTNPYGRDMDTGGSSSGSAVAVAADLTPLAVGTETSGSILSPASQNGVVGIKPTVGLVSRTGVIPISFSQDTAGPMARTVRDAALLLDALAGVDPDDPATWAQTGRTGSSHTALLRPDALRGARIGVPREPYFDKLDDARRAVLERALAALRAAGAEVIDPVAIATAGEGWDHTVLVHEFKPALNAYLAGLASHLPVHSLADVVAYNEAHADVMLRYGQAMLVKSEATDGRLTDPAYRIARVRDVRRSRAEGIDRTLAEHRLDALVFPNNRGAGIAACAGYPSVTVPAGLTAAGEPVGLTFTAGAYREAHLLGLAYAFEQADAGRVPPTLPRPA